MWHVVDMQNKVSVSTHKTKRGASVSKAARARGAGAGAYRVMSDLDYRGNILGEMKTVTNLLSGKPVQIRVNTPRSCDPSTELYFTM